MANTLNVMYEGNDSSCVVGRDFFIQNTFEKWYFGWDNTGDIMNVQNIEYFVKVVQDAGMQEIHLVCGVSK